jgi:hypothetical protein
MCDLTERAVFVEISDDEIHLISARRAIRSARLHP